KNGNNSIFEFIFPNNYQLLVGKNKKELDEDILKKLNELNFSCTIAEPQEVFLASSDTLPIVVLNGANYLDILSSEMFFKLHGEDSVLVFEEDFIPYSVSNLFLKKELSGNRALKLKYKMYGTEANISHLYLQNLIEYLKDNGFQGYVGHEKSEPEW